jgi:hypothetical protein
MHIKHVCFFSVYEISLIFENIITLIRHNLRISWKIAVLLPTCLVICLRITFCLQVRLVMKLLHDSGPFKEGIELI